MPCASGPFKAVTLTCGVSVTFELTALIMDFSDVLPLVTDLSMKPEVLPFGKTGILLLLMVLFERRTSSIRAFAT